MFEALSLDIQAQGEPDRQFLELYGRYVAKGGEALRYEVNAVWLRFTAEQRACITAHMVKNGCLGFAGEIIAAFRGEVVYW